MSNFKKGDVVRIVGKASASNRLAPYWNPRMDKTIGERGVITEIKSPTRFKVTFDDPELNNNYQTGCDYQNGWWYAAESLEKVEPVNDELQDPSLEDPSAS